MEAPVASMKVAAVNGAREPTRDSKEPTNGNMEPTNGNLEDLLEDEAQEGEIELVVQGRTIPVRKVPFRLVLFSFPF
jgi:hypothetical protein